jgi:diguanylate cyclase (GGDEF)-like protein
LGLLFCDLDRFKEINDSLGHAAGDTVLRRRHRAGDLFGRTGGDEFLVVLNVVPDLEIAMAVAQKIRRAIAQPISTALLQVRTTVSVGVTMARPDEAMDELIARADQAMYAAKQGGRNQVIPID